MAGMCCRAFALVVSDASFIRTRYCLTLGRRPWRPGHASRGRFAARTLRPVFRVSGFDERASASRLACLASL